MKLSEKSGAALPSGAGKRVAILSAAFYADLAAWLEDGATRALDDCGVPGCFEIPLAARRLIDAGYDAVVALGAVVRGDTPHFDYVAGECSRGIMDVQLATRVPIGFGILTTETLAQAQERADPARGDKGYEAAVAALAVLAVGR